MHKQPDTGSAVEHVVLHVEDSDTDAYLFRLALQEAGIPAVVYRVSDGEQAMLYLHKIGAFQLAPTPQVVFLDTNMPRMNGWEVLEAINQNQHLQRIPVIVLTTAHDGRERALSLGAREYLCKPHDFDEFLAKVQAACDSICGVAIQAHAQHSGSSQ
jgi:CheY-like chemotaxis protein